MRTGQSGPYCQVCGSPQPTGKLFVLVDGQQVVCTACALADPYGLHPANCPEDWHDVWDHADGRLWART
jgi:hypothetical protein